MAMCQIILDDVSRTDGGGLYQFKFNFIKKGIEHITLYEFFSSAPNLNIIYVKKGTDYYNANFEYLDEVSLVDDYFIWKSPEIGWTKAYSCLDENKSYLNIAILSAVFIGLLILNKNE